MGGSLRIGRIAGIDLYIHWTFSLLIVGALGYYLLIGDYPLSTALAGVGLILAVFFCVVLHELGHALTARRYNVPTRDITLYPIGGVARLQRIPEKPGQELAVAIAGPAVNVVIGLALYALLVVTGQSLIPGRGLVAPQEQFLQNLMWINVLLVAFNLLPAFPMDGGRVLRALLAMRLDYVRATQIAAAVGQGMAILFALIGIFVIFNPFLIFIALFVYLGAQQEAHMAMMRTAIEGLPVRNAMITNFTPLAQSASLAEAVQLLIAGSEQDFPVTEDERMIGVLTRRRLVQALSERGNETRVGDVMEAACEPVEEGEMLDRAFRRMQESECSMLPVHRAGRLVGVVTLENVGELVMVSSSLRKAGARQTLRDLLNRRDVPTAAKP
jgi:Zn-dependent protease/predicted transcriptional regulator